MLTWVIIGIVFVVAFGALVVGRRLRANAFSVLLVAGIVGMAVAVTVVRVQQYRDQQAPNEVVGADQPAVDAPATLLPASDQTWRTSSPMVKPPAGAAAPSVAQNPEFNR